MLDLTKKGLDMKQIGLALLLLGSSISYAEVTEVKIPGKNWGISFNMPIISQYQGKASNNSFQYVAVSEGTIGEPNTILSFFLENDSSSSNKECFDNYWSKSKKNPMIITASIKTESLQDYEQIYYKYSFGQPNANFYFVNQGYCIDVHVSLSNDMKGAEEALLSIGKSIKVIEYK